MHDIRLGLKVLWTTLPVNETVSSNDAHVHSLCQHIEQRSLSVDADQTRSEIGHSLPTLPAPDSPMRAVSFPGATYPETLFINRLGPSSVGTE